MATWIAPALHAQTNVRAWYARGETWVVWDTGGQQASTWDVYRGSNAFTGIRIAAAGPDAGRPVLSVNGLTGLAVILEFSDDLRAWQPLANATLSGSVDFVDITTPRPPKRFYRLRLP